MKRIFLSGLFTLLFSCLLVSTASAASTDMQYANVPAISTQAFTGEAVTPSFSVELYGQTLTEGEDYKITYTNNVDCGIAQAKLTGIGDFGGSKTVSFVIARPNLANASVSVSSATISAGSIKAKPPVTVTMGGKTLVEGTDYTLAYQDNTSAGIGYAIVDGIGQYTGRQVRNFSITQAQASAPSSSIYLTYGNRSKSSNISLGNRVVFYSQNVANEGMVNSITVKNSYGSTVYSTSISSCAYTNSSSQIGSYTPSSSGTYTIQYRIGSYDLVVSGGTYVCRAKSGGTTYSQTMVVSGSSSSSSTSGRVTSVDINSNYTKVGYDTFCLTADTSVSALGTNSDLTWSSSNTSVATVDSWGKVTFLAPGTVTVTATAPNGVYDTQKLTLKAVDLSSAVEGAVFYRKEHSYAVTPLTQHGSLAQDRAYTAEFIENGAYVNIILTGNGLFTGETQYRFRRPMLSALGSSVQRSGEIIVDIAPGQFTGSGTVIAASYGANGRLLARKVLQISDLSLGKSAAISIYQGAKGSFQTHFLDEMNRPLGPASGGPSTPPPTPEEQAALDAIAREAANVLKNYAIANAYSTTNGIYKSDFTANGYTGGIWYIDDGEFTISLKGSSVVINLGIDRYGYLEPTFSYDKVTSSLYCIGGFSVDLDTYSPGDPVTFVRYYTTDTFSGQEETAFIREAGIYYDRLTNMLNTFLKSYGYSLGDIGLDCYK